MVCSQGSPGGSFDGARVATVELHILLGASDEEGISRIVFGRILPRASAAGEVALCHRGRESDSLRTFWYRFLTCPEA